MSALEHVDLDSLRLALDAAARGERNWPIASALWSMDQLLSRLEAIAVLHAKRTGTNDYMAPHEYHWCVECRQVWPCATAAAYLVEEPA